MIIFDNCFMITVWRWKPVLMRAERRTVFGRYKAWGIRWGYWVFNFYWSIPL